MKKTNKGYFCDVCGKKICKCLADLKSCGAIFVQVGKNLDEKDICYECAKEIAEAVLDEF